MTLAATYNMCTWLKIHNQFGNFFLISKSKKLSYFICKIRNTIKTFYPKHNHKNSWNLSNWSIDWILPTVKLSYFNKQLINVSLLLFTQFKEKLCRDMCSSALKYNTKTLLYGEVHDNFFIFASRSKISFARSSTFSFVYSLFLFSLVTLNNIAHAGTITVLFFPCIQ